MVVANGQGGLSSVSYLANTPVYPIYILNGCHGNRLGLPAD